MRVAQTTVATASILTFVVASETTTSGVRLIVDVSRIPITGQKSPCDIALDPRHNASPTDDGNPMSVAAARTIVTYPAETLAAVGLRPIARARSLMRSSRCSFVRGPAVCRTF
jgi:hypothetical protein